MKRLLLPFLICITLGLLACQAKAEQPPVGDPLTGTWVGSFGNGSWDQNTISLELKWDGKNLTGTVKPGNPSGSMYRSFTPFNIEKASYDPSTNTIKFNALFSPRDRTYIVTGKVTRDAITGTWDRPDERRNGDFKLTRQKS